MERETESRRQKGREKKRPKTKKARETAMKAGKQGWAGGGRELQTQWEGQREMGPDPVRLAGGQLRWGP